MTTEIAELILHQAVVHSLRREFEEIWEYVDASRADDIEYRDDCWKGFLASRLELAERSLRTN